MGSNLGCCKYLKDEYELVDSLYEIDEIMFLGNVMKSIVKGRFNLKDLTSTSVKCSIKYYVVRMPDQQLELQVLETAISALLEGLTYINDIIVIDIADIDKYDVKSGY